MQHEIITLEQLEQEERQRLQNKLVGLRAKLSELEQLRTGAKRIDRSIYTKEIQNVRRRIARAEKRLNS